MEEIKQQISSSEITQQRIERCLRGDVFRTGQKVLPCAEDLQFYPNGNPGCSDQSSCPTTSQASANIVRESLQEV